MSLNKSATIRRVLLGASSLVLAAFGAAPQASAQATFVAKPQVTFPTAGNFANITPSAGADTITVAPQNALYLPVWGNFSAPSAESVTKNFLGGVNVITNNGYVFVGTEEGQVLFEGSRSGIAPFQRDKTRYEGYMRAEGLTTFNNNGAIYMGSFYEGNTSNGAGLVGTDRWIDDILSLPGAAFVGTSESRVYLDVNFNNIGQSACNTAQRITTAVTGDTGSNSLPVADCIDLAGGSATGTTGLIIHDIYFGDRGVYNPTGSVIVDLTGGSAVATSPGAFFIAGSANTEGYDPRNGGGIDKGLFLYTLGYDSAARQFKLYGLTSAGARQFPLLVHAASDLWRTSSGGWFERQVDQRNLEGEAGARGGFWGRVVSGTADRGVTETAQAGDKAVIFDNSYQQTDTAVTFGVDLISAGAGASTWAAGAMIGYVHGKVDFNDYANEANLEGMHAGLYGGFTAGQVFVDAAFNGTWVVLDDDVPAMGLLPAGTVLGTNAVSLGGRVEAGLRLRSDRFSLEPLAGLTYVRTAFEDMAVPADDPARPGGAANFEDATSMRASLGARLSIENFVPLTPVTRLSLTARQGREFDGEAAVAIANTGQGASADNSFDGQFTELSASFTAANASQTSAGYVNFNALFGDDYDNIAVSAGLRFQW